MTDHNSITFPSKSQKNEEFETALTALTAPDLQNLRSSGLSDQTIQSMGVFSLDAEAIQDLLGVTVQTSGYAIPYPRLRDQTDRPYIRVRLQAENSGQRYCGGRGDDPALYIPPGFDQLPAGDLLVVTEGEKKAAKGVQEGIPCVGVQGVWNWADPSLRAVQSNKGFKISDETPALPALLEVANRFKRILVLGDSDLVDKPRAAKGFETLAASLRLSNYAAYFACCLPFSRSELPCCDASQDKQGLDDWLLRVKPALVLQTLCQLYRSIQVVSEGLQETQLGLDFARRSERRFAFSAGRGWMRFDKTHWVPDQDSRRLVAVSDYADELRREADQLIKLRWTLEAGALDIEEDGHGSELAQVLQRAARQLLGARNMLSKVNRMKAILEFAQAHLAVTEENWDHDPNLLGVKNGVVDLRTGKLQVSNPYDYLTRCAGTAYLADATSSLWNAFIEKAQPLPIDREVLQRIAGYSSIGAADEQLAFIHYGSGANGKSTFWRTVLTVLGDYATSAGTALVERKADSREQSYELGRLPGIRLVAVSETEENTGLAIAAIKRLTGNEPVTARLMYHSPFSFKPVCKVHLSTNHLPYIPDNSHGAWRRIRVIPWTVTIPESERDPKLMTRLESELPGVLRWLVEGAAKYLKSGLCEARSSQIERAHLRDACNELQQWMQEELVVEAERSGTSGPLFLAYRVWCQTMGFTPKSVQVWNKELKALGFKKEKDSNGCMTWKGLSLRRPTENSHLLSVGGAA